MAANVATFYRPRLPSATRVSLVNGSDAALPAALAAGSLGHLTLFVTSSSLPTQSRSVLQRSGDVERVLVLGSTSSVPVAVAVTAARA